MDECLAAVEGRMFFGTCLWRDMAGVSVREVGGFFSGGGISFALGKQEAVV